MLYCETAKQIFGALGAPLGAPLEASREAGANVGRGAPRAGGAHRGLSREALANNRGAGVSTTHRRGHLVSQVHIGHTERACAPHL